MLSIVSIDPGNDSTQISLTPTITIVFNSPLNLTTVTADSVLLVSVGTVVVDFEITNGSIGTQPISDIIDCTIVADNDTITLTPQNPLTLNTNYSIIISDNIENLSTETLDSIATSNFTTVANAVEVDNSVSVNLISTNANIGDGKFRIISTKPGANKVVKNLDTETIFKFVFSEEVDSNTVADSLTVSYEGLLDDTEEEIDEPVITTTSNSVSIKVGYITTVPTDVIIKISFDATLKSLSGKFLEAQSFYYVQNTSPFYVPLKLFRLRAGQLISNIPDITLISLIVFYSQAMDVIETGSNCSAIPASIKQGFVFYNVLQHLLKTTRNAPPEYIKKGLADFTLEIGTKTQASIYNRCLADADKALNALNFYFATKCGKGLFIRSSRSYDYPDNVGRLYPESYGENLYKTRDVGSLRSRWVSGD